MTLLEVDREVERRLTALIERIDKMLENTKESQ